MINIRTLNKIENHGGLTLKNGTAVNYKTGYQVATEGIETTNKNEAMKAIKQYKGNCGIWLENGVYYIDKSHRIKTKKEAIETGKKYNQISIYNWNNGKLIYC